MGWLSVSLGRGFRVYVSKKGVGVSAGRYPFRVGSTLVRRTRPRRQR